VAANGRRRNWPVQAERPATRLGPSCCYCTATLVSPKVRAGISADALAAAAAWALPSTLTDVLVRVSVRVVPGVSSALAVANAFAKARSP
jgi:hypothetical protein